MAPVSIKGRRTRNKLTETSKNSSSVNVADQISENNVDVNCPEKTQQTDDGVLKSRPKRTRKTRMTNVNENGDGPEESATQSIEDNDDTYCFKPPPPKRNTRRTTKRTDKCNDTDVDDDDNDKEKIVVRKSKRAKKDNVETSSTSNEIDKKEDLLLMTNCFVRLSQNVDDIYKDINEVVPVSSTTPKENKTIVNEIVHKTDDVNNDNNDDDDEEMNENIPQNILLATEDLTQVNKNLASAFGEINNHKISTLMTSIPPLSTATCSEINRKISCNYNIPVGKDKLEIERTDGNNHVKAPCRCSARIQCYGPYNEGSYALKKINGAGIEIQKSLKHEKTIMAGYLKIYNGSYMSGKATNNTVYFVIEGNLKVNISGNMKYVKVNDCFMIVQDTQYEIRNIDDEPARLSFVKTSRALP